MKLLKRSFAAIEDLELLAVSSLIAGLGSALFVGLVIVFPVWLTWFFVTHSRFVSASVVFVLQLGAVTVSVRQALRRKWSRSVIVLGGLWAACLTWAAVYLLRDA